MEQYVGTSRRAKGLTENSLDDLALAHDGFEEEGSRHGDGVVRLTIF